MPETPSKAASGSSAKTRPPHRTGVRTGAGQPSPTRSLEPGHVHYRIASGILKGIQERAKEAGVNLDVGIIPDADTSNNNGADDPERLTRLVARIVARTGDRFTIVRKVSRHLEGTDKRSGVLSDVAAAFMELYKRNPEAVEQLAGQTAENFKARRVQRAASKETTQPNGGVEHASR